MSTLRHATLLLSTTGAITAGLFAFAISAAGAGGWQEGGGFRGTAGGVIRFRGGSKAVVAIAQDAGTSHEITITNLDGPNEDYRKQTAGDWLILYTWTPKRDARYRITAEGGQFNYALYDNN